MAPIISIVGDSNVRRHMNQQNCRSHPRMSTAQVKTCGKLETFAESLRSVRSDVTIVIVACLTNFLTSIDGASSSVSLRVDPVLQEFKEIMLDFAQEMPERFSFLTCQVIFSHKYTSLPKVTPIYILCFIL